MPDSGLPPAWESWHYWRALELSATGAPRLAKATLPIEVYAQAQTHLADLRLMDDTWTEVPYVLEARQGHRTQQWRDASVVDLSEIPGLGTHAVAEIPVEVERHNSIEILTDESDFVAFVEVAASGSLPPPEKEESAWRIIRDSAHIFRLRKDGLEGVRTVSYPVSTARFLRLRIRREEGKGLKLSGIRVAYEELEAPELVKLPVEKVTQPAAAGGAKGQSLWLLDLGSGKVPASQVRFEVGTPVFHRGVEVWTSENGTDWQRVGSATLHRMASPLGTLVPAKPLTMRSDIAQLSSGPGASGLVVEFPERRGRYWRVAVMDRNDAPLSDVRIEILGTPRHLLFRQEPRRSYRLLYGNERADAPQYELARLLPPGEREQAVAAVVGTEQVNTGWRDPRPWTERHPVVLWVALGIAVAALGLLALRSLRQA
ncbi:MAG: DUF3999 family protein [Candidatus Acidiferrales bacterium]